MMAATRAELEAVIHSWLTRAVAAALTPGGSVTAIVNRGTEAILREADKYASEEVGLLTPAERRRVIEQAVTP